jgi:glucose-6-phosphate 1-dehydrogenase
MAYPTTLVIFGASGDLTARKLIPALYRNHRKGRLVTPLQILGISRSPMSDEEFQKKMRTAVREFAAEDFREDEWNVFAAMLHYHASDINERGQYVSLLKRLNASPGSTETIVFYLATVPDLYPIIIGGLHSVGLLNESDPGDVRRVVIEKPFGRDLPTALALNRQLHGVLQERQIFRIDHYLGKETVQNLLVLRFGNAIFEPLWNRNYVDHVQITVAETVGVEHRAGYYDKTGALRDMFQNHLLQLLTIVAMESPIVYDADALRNEKANVLRALRQISPEHSARSTIRAQYAGYLKEPGVGPGSTTETYAALRLFIDNWRWQGVPFYLRTGKRMKQKTSEIIVQFRRPPMQILDVAAGRTELFTNRLTISIQPNEGIRLSILTKVPDRGMETRPVDMDFGMRESFGEHAIPEAYERLLLDALQGDASLFARSDEIELSWKITDSIRAGWESEYAAPVASYDQESWGPSEADMLLGRDGRWWESAKQ